jgi:arylsulfatase A-like enzyme
LPGLLKELGYSTYQLTMRHYADAMDVNMLGAFDWANNRNLSFYNTSWVRRFSYNHGTVFYFTRTIFERIHERIFHILRLSESENVYQWMHGETAQEVGADQRKMDRALELISEQAEKPFFLSMHLLETHCCPFLGIDKANQKDESILQKSYKKAIYRNDKYLAYFAEELRSRGLLDNTIFVYFSDHGPHIKMDPSYRVPLVIRFPKAEHRMQIQQYTQLDDIAPTILDYMRVQIPEWMDGKSLLHPPQQAENNALFQIFSVKTQKIQRGLTPRGEPVFFNQLTHIGPPFYGITEVVMLHCQKWFHLNLETPVFNWGNIKNASECAQSEIDASQARQEIFAFLEKHEISLPAYLNHP